MQQYWTLLDLNHVTKGGRKVYNYKCNICGGTYKNASNAADHCQRCLKKHEHVKKNYMTVIQAFGLNEGDEVPNEVVEPKVITPRKNGSDSSISKDHKALIELIAEHNIPFTQLESDSWENFIHTLNPGFVIPMKDQLRKLILEHSENVTEKGLNDLRGYTCGLAVDGATLISLHIYAFVLVFKDGLRLAGFEHVESQTGKELADAITKIMTKCEQHNIEISCIVSDNAASLKSAITNTDESKGYSLKAAIGEEVLRCACAAHTSQLAVKDLIEGVDYLEEFYSNVVNLISFISMRSDDFKKLSPYKMPHFIDTRWNTLYNCSSFIFKNKSSIDEWLKEYITFEQKRFDTEQELFNSKRKKYPPKPIEFPPINEVPEEWATYIEPLEVIAGFTNCIEGDLCLQQDVYISVLDAESKLESLAQNKNYVAETLYDKFHHRFTSTADLTLAHLAFLFTPTGLDDFRSLPNDREKVRIRLTLKKKFLDISKVLTQKKFTNNTHFLPALFDYYLDRVEFGTGEYPFNFWKYSAYESAEIEHINDGRPIPLDNFSHIALCLITLPASEAMIERAFSQVKAISTRYNKSMLIDLYWALSSIKIAIKYARKYPVHEFNTIIE